MPCNENHFIPILDELQMLEDQTNQKISENPCPSVAKKGTGWGGRRPGAGARKGNLNALKHGRFSRYQQAFIEALMQVPETREIMVAISKRRRAQTRRAEEGGAALMSELTRKIGVLALHGDDHLEDIHEFLASIRMAEAQLEKILEKRSSANAKKRNSIKPNELRVSTRRARANS